ncbi:MAG: hypothetical protein AAGN46_01200 [Acidobacteriota bacterium]
MLDLLRRFITSPTLAGSKISTSKILAGLVTLYSAAKAAGLLVVTEQTLGDTLRILAVESPYLITLLVGLGIYRARVGSDRAALESRDLAAAIREIPGGEKALARRAIDQAWHDGEI